MTDDPMASRSMTDGEASALACEYAALRAKAARFDRPTRFSEERDRIFATLEAAGRGNMVARG